MLELLLSQCAYHWLTFEHLMNGLIFQFSTCLLHHCLLKIQLQISFSRSNWLFLFSMILDHEQLYFKLILYSLLLGLELGLNAILIIYHHGGGARWPSG